MTDGGGSSKMLVGIARHADEGWLAAGPYADRSILRRLLHGAMREAGLGARDPGHPLKDIVRQGASVLVKPNWVLDVNKSGETMDCMITHAAVLSVLLEEVAAAGPSRIVIGDAPVQGCALERIATQERTEEWQRLCGGIPLEILDFRRTIVRDGDLVRGLASDLRPMERYVLFDLGASSLLEPVSTPRGSFRVTQYDPRKLALAHRSGRHQYLIAKEALEADVVLNVPKLKTHKKAGITAGLKNLVGINGNKDFLPHHRIGGSLLGGDCYEGMGPLKRAAEFCLDRANRRLGSSAYTPWARRASRLMDCQERLTGLADLEGSWHGNDTVWRTVLDLNRILVYGGADGTMASSPRRSVHTITDAIVCGQGEGPLAPSPAPLGAITFSSNPVAADRVHCALLRLDPDRIPMVREASGEFRWPLAPGVSALEIRYRGRSLTLEEVARELGTTARAPRGWAGRIEWPSAPETTPAFLERM